MKSVDVTVVGSSNKEASNDITAKIKNRAETSKVFNILCHVFALRQRTRRQITIHSLFVTMTKEGFNFTKDDYRKELEFLAEIGIGTLERSKTGVVKALKNIKITLQSIGMTGVGKRPVLQAARLRNLYTQLPETTTVAKQQVKPELPAITPNVVEAKKPKSAPAPQENYEATIAFKVNDKKMVVHLEPNVSPSELFAILFEINSKSTKSE